MKRVCLECEEPASYEHDEISNGKLIEVSSCEAHKCWGCNKLGDQEVATITNFDVQRAIDTLITDSGYSVESEDAYQFGYLDALTDIYMKLFIHE